MQDRETRECRDGSLTKTTTKTTRLKRSNGRAPEHDGSMPCRARAISIRVRGPAGAIHSMPPPERLEKFGDEPDPDCPASAGSPGSVSLRTPRRFPPSSLFSNPPVGPFAFPIPHPAGYVEYEWWLHAARRLLSCSGIHAKESGLLGRGLGDKREPGSYRG